MPKNHQTPYKSSQQIQNVGFSGKKYVNALLNTGLENTNFKKGYFCALFGLILFLFPFFPTGNFFNNWISIIFYTNLSVMILYKNI